MEIKGPGRGGGEPPGQNSQAAHCPNTGSRVCSERGRNQRGSSERKGYFHLFGAASNNQGRAHPHPHPHPRHWKPRLGTSTRRHRHSLSLSLSPLGLEEGRTAKRLAGSFVNKRLPPTRCLSLEPHRVWLRGAFSSLQKEAGEAQRSCGCFSPGCSLLPRVEAAKHCIVVQIWAGLVQRGSAGQRGLRVRCGQPLQKYLLCFNPEGLF